MLCYEFRTAHCEKVNCVNLYKATLLPDLMSRDGQQSPPKHHIHYILSYDTV